MKPSQVKWLIIGLAGSAFCMFVVVGGVFWLAMSAIPSSRSDNLDWEPSPSSESDEEDYGVDAPAEWHRDAIARRNADARNKPELDRLRALYEYVSPYHEIRRRLHLEADFAYAEAELEKQFAAISDPLAALDYSTTIDRLGELTYDTEPEDLRAVVREWTETYPDSHFAWLVRGHQALSYAWYWRGGGWASTVSEEGWENFGNAIQEAAECFDRAYKLEPNDPEIGVGMITICYAQSRPRREMEKHFERTTKIVPAHLAAYSGKFQYLRPAWAGSWPEYREFLDSIDAKVEEQDHPILRIAARHARDSMERELDGDGKTMDQRNQESRRQWLEIRKAMAERWPDDVLTRAQYAKELMRNKNIYGAQKEYDWIGNRYPMEIGQTVSYFHQQRFQAYMMVSMNLRGQARLDMCHRALEFDPGYYANYQALGLAHEANGDYDLAEEAILRAIEVDPTVSAPHYQLARLYKSMNRLDEAIDEIEAAKKLKIEDNMRSNIENFERELKAAARENNLETQP